MTDPPFHLTEPDRAFNESTLPQLVEELARLNAALVDLIHVIERRAGGGHPAPPVSSRSTPRPTEHSSHVASSLNPHP